MAAILKCQIQCDGCGVPFEHELFNSVGEARDASWKSGWMTGRLCNRLFDFCKTCQTEEKKDEAKRLGKAFGKANGR